MNDYEKKLDALIERIEKQTGGRALLVLARNGDEGINGELHTSAGLNALQVVQVLATALASFVHMAAPTAADRDALLGSLIPLFAELTRIEDENPEPTHGH